MIKFMLLLIHLRWLKHLKLFGHTEKISKKILIVGGGNIGFNLAKNLRRNFRFSKSKNC